MANIINLATEDNQEKILKALTSKDGRAYVPLMQKYNICTYENTYEYTANIFFEDIDFIYFSDKKNSFRRINKKSYAIEEFIFTSTNETAFGYLYIDNEAIYAVFSEKKAATNSPLYTWLIKIAKNDLSIINKVRHDFAGYINGTSYNQTSGTYSITCDSDFIYISNNLYTTMFLYKFRKSDLTKIGTFNTNSTSDEGSPKLIHSNGKLVFLSQSFGAVRVYDTAFQLLYTTPNTTGTPMYIYQLDDNNFIIQGSGITYSKLDISTFNIKSTVVTPYSIAFIDSGYIYYFVGNKLKRLSTDFIFDNQFYEEYEKIEGNQQAIFKEKNSNHSYVFDITGKTFYEFTRKYKIIAYEGVE